MPILKRYFQAIRQVQFAFLFGSAATEGMLRLDSDVDVAAYFRVVPDAIALKSLQEDIASLLGREVDLVLLNGASPILKMQVLRNGRLILCRNRKGFYQFIEKVVNEYDDLKRIRRQCEENILKGRIYA